MKLLLLPDLRMTFGGPSTFQNLLAGLLEKRGVSIQYDPVQPMVDTLLLINATRHLDWLLKLKKQRVRIVQRLGTPTDYSKSLPIPFWLRIKNSITMDYMALLRRYYADAIVYQSHFVQEEWNEVHGKIFHKQEIVIHNGVDTEHFSPLGEVYQSSSPICIISVEGNQGNDPYNIALNLTTELISQGKDVELLMLGKPWGNIQEKVREYPFVRFMGFIDKQNVPFYLRGADVFISTDVIAGCPNSVLESLSCGTPVVGYNCGVLKELIEDGAGICVNPEGDPWMEQNPGNIKGLAKAVQDIVSRGGAYRTAARNLVERKYSADIMIDKYSEVLFNKISS